MTTIKINPDQLYQIAQKVDQGRQQLDQMNRQLYGHLVSMQMLWLGMTQERFFQDYEHSRPVLERALEHMVKMAVELRTIATRFSEADAEQGGYQAAIGGAVGLGTHGAASTDTGPGYRMAYNSFLGKWLPVNEQGVTDQAALQAYERDKGHLDVNAMQGDIQSEPLGEDIMDLQIKAFQEGMHPFTGERVSDNYAAMMVTSLKLSQVFMGIQAIRGSMPGRKGPYRLSSNHPVVQKIQKNMEAVRAEKSMQPGVATGNVERYSGDLVKVNKPDAAADALAVRISGQSRVKYSNDPDHREFDAVSDQYVAQSKPALQTVNKSVRNQMKATFEAAQESGKTVYYHFEGQPAQSVIDKLKEYSSRYGIEVVIDTKPLK
ncbi:hypothetical protein D3C74_155280 [compost metagenome]